ncbi:MAG: winged-helix domain-containing protein [Atopobiaceae bacterium]|nr:winged-helix domain-containing protein [Atopobiaceae bacterium]
MAVLCYSQVIALQTCDIIGLWGDALQHHRNILLVSKAQLLRDRMTELSHSLDVSTLIAPHDAFEQAISSGHEFDLVILDLNGANDDLEQRVDDYISENGCMPILFVVTEDRLSSLRQPTQSRSDFVMANSSDLEFELRLSQLLWPGEETAPSDLVHIDNMTINLATYQVYVDDNPVDLTLMEYSLLSFLATHPSRAYSREALLHRVWGFEYCGGTRTVDVHIRRVRSKVGLQVASHIVTVRGVGYLFKL